MKPKLRAPLTAHLRKRLRPTSETQGADNPKKIRRGRFADNDVYEWVKITPDVSKNLRVLTPPVSPDDDHAYCTTAREDELCHVLEMIANKHEKQKHPFIAMTAKVAIRLIRTGRSAEINPGLLSHVREMKECLLDK
ncbi:hypothetical protein BWQ96_05294 [Gracilariopsis chorda]|uniref:Uncharacterized protein n=1 Tax=Gracilariopsis chorda TaxID=448386 RepID=A0A2V3IUW9_9FLOR|nr:hypothetical protein BWQ96_05294 [Gracilariopsis chorda]|eukprot:PXF44930.1 hypothetical protein BWQ96_05294 [Gracilariopsis chorda]